MRAYMDPAGKRQGVAAESGPKSSIDLCAQCMCRMWVLGHQERHASRGAKIKEARRRDDY